VVKVEASDVNDKLLVKDEKGTLIALGEIGNEQLKVKRLLHL